MKIRYLVIITICISTCFCGFNGEQKFAASESGSTTNDINVNFTFINQLITLCQEKLLPEQYSGTELYNQAVANCVFDSLSIVTTAANPLCQGNADLSGFTPEQIQQIQATCQALGGK